MSKTPNKSSSNKIKIMAALASIAIVAAVIIGVSTRSVEDPLTPNVFQPVQTTRVSFDVYKMSDPINPIGSIVVGDASSKFFDPNYIYPRIGSFRSSDPYPVDNAGAYTGSVQIATPEKHVFGNTVIYRHTAKFGYDFGQRTFTALPARNTDTFRQLTPISGMSVSVFNIRASTAADNTMSVDNTNRIFYVPRGTMICSFDKGVNPWAIRSPVGTAHISQSLENIDYEGERAGNPASGLTFADAINRLASEYGNTAVTVRARITLSGVNNFERYDYEQHAMLSNGTMVKITLKTTSALVGFEDASFVKQPWAGIIPKAFDEQFDRAGLDGTDPEGESGNAFDAPQSQTSSPMTASLYYDGDVSLPGGNVITRMMTPVEAWTSIDNTTPTIYWNDILAGSGSGLPTSIDVCGEFDLQPQTTIKIANMRATGTIKSYSGFEPGLVEYQNYDVSYQVPYALKIDNVAVMYSALLTMDLFTKSDVVMVTSTGLPVDVTKLVDFDLGSVLGNPRADNMIFRTWSENTLMDQITTILIIVGVILGTILAIAIVLKIRGGSGFKK